MPLLIYEETNVRLLSFDQYELYLQIWLSMKLRVSSLFIPGVGWERAGYTGILSTVQLFSPILLTKLTSFIIRHMLVYLSTVTHF